jgi:hypothetical protein
MPHQSRIPRNCPSRVFLTEVRKCHGKPHLAQIRHGSAFSAEGESTADSVPPRRYLSVHAESSRGMSLAEMSLPLTEPCSRDGISQPACSRDGISQPALGRGSLTVQASARCYKCEKELPLFLELALKVSGQPTNTPRPFHSENDHVLFSFTGPERARELESGTRIAEFIGTTCSAVPVGGKRTTRGPTQWG